MSSSDQKERDRAEIQENFKRLQAMTEANAKAIAENAKKTNESIEKTKEAIAETRKAIAETNKAVEKNIKDTAKWRVKSKNFVKGSIDNERGDFVETITRANLGRLLKDRGITIHRIYSNITDEGKKKWEIDVMAINGEEIVFIETKTTLSTHKVKRFIENTLLKIGEHFPEYKGKKIYGAVAFLESKKDADPRKDQEVGQDAAGYALEQGLFVISVAGDSARMLNDKSFVPKAF